MNLRSIFKKQTDNTPQKRCVGELGESIACNYLSSLGFEIIARNVHISHKEIDIVAENDEYTLIVEVKTVSKSKKDAQEQSMRPSDNIDKAKMQNLIYAQKGWRTKYYSGRTVRIDVIEVYLGDTPPSVVHIENAVNNRTLYRKRR